LSYAKKATCGKDYEYFTAYHGTDARAAKRILKEGLKPVAHWVWLTDSKSEAKGYGDVILEVKLPKRFLERRNVVVDDIFAVAGNIPKRFIRRVN
jgi:RNA:NAD 2'-phosphotransferase (TPT1/KptA family)